MEKKEKTIRVDFRLSQYTRSKSLNKNQSIACCQRDQWSLKTDLRKRHKAETDQQCCHVGK